MRAAAIQINSTADRAANRRAADEHARAAIADGATLIVLPEKWAALGSARTLLDGAEDLDGPALSWAGGLAAAAGVDVVAGSIVQRLPGGRLANVCVHFGPDGQARASYRKIHLFDVEVDGIAYRESEHEDAGAEVVCSQTSDGVRLGLSICYDVRFPELYRALVDDGARVLPLPAAFTLATTRDHWETLVRARAIENQAFVVAANQIGDDGEGHRSGGRSMIVDPWGVVLAQAPDRACHIVADLDWDYQDDVRRRQPALEHRRGDLYAREALR